MKQKYQKRKYNPMFKKAERKSYLYNSNQNPDEFKCPITLEIMTDPVILSDGQTFERASILESFRFMGNKSPITRKTVSQELIPNIALRKRIEDWIQGYSQDIEGGGFIF